jgi:6-phosphogluconate dehydrogenase
VIVEGGNSKYTDDQVHDVMCREKGIGYIDAGVSGGVWGLENGYALMVGGTKDDVATVQPIFDALRPPSPKDESGQEMPGAGFVHAGPVGAGHFSKMVHNGIEYAMMQAYGEGYELLAAVDLIEDVPGVIASWTQGTVIRSWLLDLLVRALHEDPQLERITGYAEDSGEGRWTVEQAIENAVPMPTIAASLFARFVSRQDDSPTMKAVAALRQQFGGHAVHAVRAQEAERPA